MALDKIEKIRDVTEKLKPEGFERPPNKDYFEALMNQRKVQVEEVPAQQKEIAKKTENTIFDEVRQLNPHSNFMTRTSPTELASQTDNVVAQIDVLKDKLETPNLEIKGSVQTVLRSKLNHIDENLKVALDKAGLDYVAPEAPKSLAKPIERFLGMLTHSQGQLETLAEDVRTYASKEKELSPANMLLIQLKVSYIQSEIELFTSMLNKALESTKTIMNVQV